MKNEFYIARDAKTKKYFVFDQVYDDGFGVYVARLKEKDIDFTDKHNRPDFFEHANYDAIKFATFIEESNVSWRSALRVPIDRIEFVKVEIKLTPMNG